MTKSILASAILATALLTASCEKENETTLSQTENVTLQKNESYTFVLPQNTSDDPYQITTNAQHSSISQLGTNNDGSLVYRYTPSTDYTGTDKVIIQNVEEDHSKEAHKPHPKKDKKHPDAGNDNDNDKDHPKKGGSCHNDEEEVERIITINFNIAQPTTTQKTNSEILSLDK